MFDLIASGIGRELTGNYSDAISVRGGFNPKSNMNIAMYFPKRHEVFYLGWMTQFIIEIPSNVYETVFGGRTRYFRGRQERLNIEVTAYQNRDAYKNLDIIMNRALDFSSYTTADDYKGTLLGYIDLENGDQFRFMFPTFFIQDVKDRLLSCYDEGEFMQTTFRGSPDYYLKEDNKWDLIEEQKKIDYSTIKTLEHL